MFHVRLIFYIHSRNFHLISFIEPKLIISNSHSYMCKRKYLTNIKILSQNWFHLKKNLKASLICLTQFSFSFCNLWHTQRLSNIFVHMYVWRCMKMFTNTCTRAKVCMYSLCSINVFIFRMEIKALTFLLHENPNYKKNVRMKMFFSLKITFNATVCVCFVFESVSVCVYAYKYN
jgi:hypothetical protein